MKGSTKVIRNGRSVRWKQPEYQKYWELVNSRNLFSKPFPDIQEIYDEDNGESLIAEINKNTYRFYEAYYDDFDYDSDSEDWEWDYQVCDFILPESLIKYCSFTRGDPQYGDYVIGETENYFVLPQEGTIYSKKDLNDFDTIEWIPGSYFELKRKKGKREPSFEESTDVPGYRYTEPKIILPKVLYPDSSDMKRFLNVAKKSGNTSTQFIKKLIHQANFGVPEGNSKKWYKEYLKLDVTKSKIKKKYFFWDKKISKSN